MPHTSAPADAVVALRLQHLAAGLMLKLIILTNPVVTGCALHNVTQKGLKRLLEWMKLVAITAVAKKLTCWDAHNLGVVRPGNNDAYIGQTEDTCPSKTA